MFSTPRWGHHIFSALPSHDFTSTLALKLFRGEPAISGFYFTPLPGFFSPFPHGTGSLSVTEEYLALPDGPGGFRQDSSCPAVLRCCLVLLHYFGYGAVTLFRRTSHSVRL